MKDNDLINTRVLVVFAHPDDAEFTAGGTIARWVAEGREVHYAVCTDGGKGAETDQIKTADLIALRQSEQRYFPEQLSSGLQPHQIDEVYLFGTDQPDVWIDISDTFDRKVEAIRQHSSQSTDFDHLIQHVAEWNGQVGRAKGYTYAEAFKLIQPQCAICR